MPLFCDVLVARMDGTDLLLRGALFTLELTAIGALLGVGLGIVGALVRAWNIRPFAGIFAVYVELIRNTVPIPPRSSAQASRRSPGVSWKPRRHWR